MVVRLEDILEKVSLYQPEADLDIVKKAYVFSGMVHKGQTRVTGEPYLMHPLEVANILTTLKMDPDTVATGLLHDTVEDTHTTVEKIEEVFGADVALLVDGLTKISRISFDKKEDHEAENFRKILIAMARDIRVIIVKLADRLHNMRTLEPLRPDKRRKIARETMDIYAPIANRIGIGWVKAELEDLSFKYLEPEKYGRLVMMTERLGNERELYIDKVMGEIETKLSEYGIEGTITGRPKHLYGIYKKMEDQDIEFDKIHDLIGFRLIVDSVRDCYAALGIVHSAWRPVPGRFKDYIGIPKPNLYQSLHTTVIGPEGERMEIQIRTEEMHRVAEYGIAAHWMYKEGKAHDNQEGSAFAWLRQLLEWQKDLKDSGEFMDTVKVDLFPEEVFVFTPQGSVKELPVGASPIDFAYAIHTDIGHNCAGAKVDGRLVPLRHRLRNGNVVEIITSENHHPSKEWLNFVVTSKARTRIRHWLRDEEQRMSIALGRDICEQEFKKYDLVYARLIINGELESVAKKEFGLADIADLEMNIGFGKIPINTLLGKLLPPEKLEKMRDKKVSRFRSVLNRFKSKQKPQTGGVQVKGVDDDIMVRFARCCNPLPGDDIMGFISHGQGVAVHMSSCQNLLNVDPERRIDVEWQKDQDLTRPVKIRVECLNAKGLLAAMSDAINQSDSNVRSADIKTTPDGRAINIFEIEVKDTKHLKGVMKALLKIKKVTKVERIKV